ncbi:hypothetical protein P7K49_012137 [Saguinus oedipus]|uniref:Uncharacterized protein n=1 Tax=Saguinus oedipus TaxID=9490 RepID=A0ABQ9VT87_SAGOE|nr:hypothetical protein P7K49_012137 [Saguinus oedipus]
MLPDTSTSCRMISTRARPVELTQHTEQLAKQGLTSGTPSGHPTHGAAASSLQTQASSAFPASSKGEQIHGPWLGTGLQDSARLNKASPLSPWSPSRLGLLPCLRPLTLQGSSLTNPALPASATLSTGPAFVPCPGRGPSTEGISTWKSQPVPPGMITTLGVWGRAGPGTDTPLPSRSW